MIATSNGRVSTLDFALSFRLGGLSPVPIRADGSKAPTLPTWKPLQEAIMSEHDCRYYFTGNAVGVGIVHGKVSGNSECIDIDDGRIAGEFMSLLGRIDFDLQQKLTVVQTPRPALHLYYRCSEIAGNQKLAKRGNRETIIETRGEGGYTIAYGSPPECHESGKPYLHVSGPDLTILQEITPEERQTLFDLARSFNELIEEPKPQDTPQQEGLAPGADFNQRGPSWEKLLEPAKWVRLFESQGKTYWRRPGKSVGTSATTGCKSKAGVDLFYVFSSNAHPFEDQASYSKFAVYTILQYGGDYSAAAKQLASEGYGDKHRPGMQDLRPDEYREPLDDEPPKHEPNENEVRFRMNWMSSAELAAGDFSQDYLIEDALVRGQSALMAGPFKGCKTGTLVDMGVNLAAGGKFLGKLQVTRPTPTGIVCGEGGFGELQERGIRTASHYGYHLCDLPLWWSDSLPQLSNPAHLKEIERFITTTGIEVLILDPAYLMIDGTEAEKYFAIGKQLRGVAELCKRLEVTWLLATHSKKNTLTQYDPLTLADISWSGFAEFARQWLLVNRRERYEEGSGEHKLWLSVGGSAGHSDLWAVDISEGTRKSPDGRFWNVECRFASEVESEAREEAEQRREAKREAEAAKQVEGDRKAVVEAMTKLGKPETLTTIAAVARLPGARTRAAIVDLMNSRDVAEVEIRKGSNRKYAAYEVRCNE